jgi:predicted ester cyclase
VTGADPKAVVRRFVGVMNTGDLDRLAEVCAPELAERLRSWIAPFLRSFPDMRMEVVELVAEGERVVGRFRCSATHRGRWRGHEPTGRRFEGVDEVGFFTVRDGRIAETWSIEDTLDRLRQLDLPAR